LLPYLPTITDSPFFQNLSPSQRGFILGHANTASRRIIFDSRQEDANEKHDRVWRRWQSFCTKGGLANNPYLLDVCDSNRELFLPSFLSLYRQASWDGEGKLTGHHQKPVVAGTVRDAASYLALAFRKCHRTSPLHIAGSNNMLANIRALFKAYDNVYPAPQCQKAITPKLLQKLFNSSGAETPKLQDTAPAVAADPVIRAFLCQASLQIHNHS
jgi:hypothetical protein